MAYNPQDEYDQAKKYAESLNQAVDIGAAPQIQNITGQIQGVQEQFNPYRNAAEVQSRIDAKTLAEQMANTGLTRSGTNLTASTALQTTKQNTLSGINKAESAARKDLISQLNAYIAQRDAAKQNNLATAQQQAYQNVSEFNRTTALAEINQGYAKEMAKINNDYNIANTRLANELASAREDKNWARESALQEQQAELNRQHDITIANLNAQHAAEQQRIDNEAAAARDAANNAAAMERQAADNSAAMARTQYSASKSASSSAKKSATKQATAYGKELANSIKKIADKDKAYYKETGTVVNNTQNAEYNGIISLIKAYGNDPASFEAAVTSAGLLTYWTQIAANPDVQASMIQQALYPQATGTSNRNLTR